MLLLRIPFFFMLIFKALPVKRQTNMSRNFLMGKAMDPLTLLEIAGKRNTPPVLAGEQNGLSYSSSSSMAIFRSMVSLQLGQMRPSELSSMASSK